MKEEIQKALRIAYKQRDNANRETHASHKDFNEGRVSAYEHCLELLAEYEKTEAKAKSDLEAAAIAVLDMEYERVNAGRGEPYYPLANPGQFDPRVVDLAELVAVSYLNTAPEKVTPCHESITGDPKNLCDSVSMLTKVFVCIRSVQSTFPHGSDIWSFCGKSCAEVEEAIRWLERVPQASTRQNEFVTPCHETDLHLDVDMEQARALHRVWRALNDGDCPKCHTFHRASDIRTDFGRPMPIAEWDGSFVTHSIACPTCGFMITSDEIAGIQKLFAPAMDAAVAIFENWRENRSARKGDAS